MQLTLKRQPSTGECTLGELFLEGEHECFTLEDVVRDVKVAGETAIPAGTYEIAVTYSNRFKRALPLLINVPGFEGIRIHSGNRASDTEGCILVGRTQGTDFVGESRMAFEVLFQKILQAVPAGKIFIEIIQGES